MDGVIKMRGNGLTAAGITGQEYVAPHVSFRAVNMKLLFRLLHSKRSFCWYYTKSIAQKHKFFKHPLVSVWKSLRKKKRSCIQNRLIWLVSGRLPKAPASFSI